MNQYGKGRLFVLTVPDNFTDLYEMPEGALNAVRSYILGDFPVAWKRPRIGRFPGERIRAKTPNRASDSAWGELSCGLEWGGMTGRSSRPVGKLLLGLSSLNP